MNTLIKVWAFIMLALASFIIYPALHEFSHALAYLAFGNSINGIYITLSFINQVVTIGNPLLNVPCYQVGTQMCILEMPSTSFINVQVPVHSLTGQFLGLLAPYIMGALVTALILLNKHTWLAGFTIPFLVANLSEPLVTVSLSPYALPDFMAVAQMEPALGSLIADAVFVVAIIESGWLALKLVGRA